MSGSASVSEAAFEVLSGMDWWPSRSCSSPPSLRDAANRAAERRAAGEDLAGRSEDHSSGSEPPRPLSLLPGW